MFRAIIPFRSVASAPSQVRYSFQSPVRCYQRKAQVSAKRFASSSRFKPLGQTFTLPSGRLLGYHTSGVPDGIPVIYIHGHPDSGIRVADDLEDKVAKRLGIRWIGPDRPGVGLSTMCDKQQVSEYAQDIHSLVNHLQLDECFIYGVSGGSGHTLACAWDPPPQLRGLGLCAGIGPVECGFESMGDVIRDAWYACRDHPVELAAYLEAEYVPLAQALDATQLRARTEADLRSYLTGKDLEISVEEGALASAVRIARQVHAQGAAAHARGIEVNMRNWGFDLADIKLPGIRLWYGSQDVHTPPAMGKYMAERLPGAVYKEYAGKTHLTIWDEEGLEDMLGQLVGARG
jgi:pimeloyl-ACP methyl ester carboxylesterase